MVGLTLGGVGAVTDQAEHFALHLDHLVLGLRRAALPLLKGLPDLAGEEVGADGVNDPTDKI